MCSCAQGIVHVHARARMWRRMSVAWPGHVHVHVDVALAARLDLLLLFRDGVGELSLKPSALTRQPRRKRLMQRVPQAHHLRVGVRC